MFNQNKKVIPFLVPESPNFIKFVFNLKKIWRRSYFTNFGPEYFKLKNNFANYLNTKNLAIVSSGTTAEEVLFSILKLQNKNKYEVITTPYSFISSSNAIIRSGLKPVFVDIDKNLSLNVELVEKNINKKTLAILLVDVYGIPNNYRSLQNIAKKYSIPIVCDKSHSFGVKINNKSSLVQSNLSFASLHATKLMSALEGGIIYSFSKKNLDKVMNYSNFGFGNKQTSFIGTNAKIDELRCAFASNLLKQLPKIIQKRKKIYDKYINEGLEKYVPNFIIDFEKTGNWNYSYLPIKINPRERDNLYNYLKENGIITKKYFENIIPDFYSYKINKENWQFGSALPISKEFSISMICLPIYSSMNLREVKRVTSAIKTFMSS